MKYLKSQYGNNIVVVFDGYEKSNLKNFERHRHYGGASEIKIQIQSKEIVLKIDQENFLTSSNNKFQFITIQIYENIGK